MINSEDGNLKNNKKVVLIGLDCATPRTLFQDFIEECPNIKKLMENGAVIPPLPSPLGW